MGMLERVRLALGGAMLGALVSGFGADVGMIPDAQAYDTLGAAFGFMVFYRLVGIEPIKI